MIWKRTVGIMVGLMLCGLASGETSPAETGTPRVARLDEILSGHGLGEGEDLSRREVLRGDGVSAHLVQARGRLRPHFHRGHEETVYLLEGDGVMIIGDRAYPVRAGSLMIIPRGTIHSYEAKQPTVALSIFNPPFDGEDHYFVDTAREVDPLSPSGDE